MARFRRISAVATALCLCAFASACNAVYTAERFVFDSDIMLSVRLYGRHAEQAADEMQTLLDDLARAVDATVADSDVGRLNAAAVGSTVTVGAICYDLIGAAEELYAKTSGAFNAALLPLSKLWKVDAESLLLLNGAQPDALPDYDEVTAAMATATPASWLRAETQDGYTVTKLAPAEIDLGALAKGWAADRCADIARNYGLSARIDLSGNLYLVGSYFNERNGRNEDWYIGVIAPRPIPQVKRDYVTVLHHKGDTSIVTSGDYERYYLYNNLTVPHIIGRDGIPVGLRYDADTKTYAATDHIVSATVVGPSSMLCDAYATAVCVMGPEEGMRFLSSTGYGALILTADGKYCKHGVELCYTDTYDGLNAYTEIPWQST